MPFFFLEFTLASWAAPSPTSSRSRLVGTSNLSNFTADDVTSKEGHAIDTSCDVEGVGHVWKKRWYVLYACGEGTPVPQGPLRNFHVSWSTSTSTSRDFQLTRSITLQT
ncbi:uncharacterized protein M421DRAFT_291039 [Didymella exigua CBS 183.55]|uniref:Uncharacterized protein n=1 Tax=Didymella exigua CBS 183.55 TaxID=1150837 RepID=A0A6A5RZE6_9PLEO|nr:uncharacterized protein M421DRAFT_291039 [Didymella exigua CBS 183.55]KAF1932398.1 hypothetical protein M421DRAFT_291039 [Didymella exigua CBS 183.55]